MGVYMKQNPEKFQTIPTTINNVAGGGGTAGVPSSGLTAVSGPLTAVFGGLTSNANNSVKDIVYLESIDTYVVFVTQITGSPTGCRLETYQEDANGVLVKQSSVTLSGNNDLPLDNSMAVKLPATIGCVFNPTGGASASLYEATIGADGSFGSTFTTALGTGVGPLAYNSTHDRWLIVGANNIEIVTAGSTTISASDTWTGSSDGIVSGSGSVVLCIADNVAMGITVGASSVVADEANELTITSQGHNDGDIVYLPDDDVFIVKCIDDKIYPITLSGTTPSEGTGVTQPTDLDFTDMTYNRDKSRLFMSGVWQTPASTVGHGIAEIFYSGGTITFGDELLIHSAAAGEMRIASNGDKIGFLLGDDLTKAFISSGTLV